MRLIDADSLIDLVTDSTILGDGFKTAFCALVNGEPTVKVQKTGKWIEHEDWYDTYYECSSCGEAFSLIEGTPKDNGYNYCPNCGADMRGEEE